MVYVTNEKRDYIRVLHEALSPLLDFDRCDYACNGITQQEYMRITDKLGSVAYFDITGLTCTEILKDVCKTVLINEARLAPKSLIVDINKKRKVANLFRR